MAGGVTDHASWKQGHTIELITAGKGTRSQVSFTLDVSGRQALHLERWQVTVSGTIHKVSAFRGTITHAVVVARPAAHHLSGEHLSISGTISVRVSRRSMAWSSKARSTKLACGCSSFAAATCSMPPTRCGAPGGQGARLDNTVAWPACPESGRRGETVRSVVRPRSVFQLLNTLAAAADLPLGAPAARPVCS